MNIPAPKEGDVIVVWFSNGAASAVAWQETLRKYGSLCDVRAVNNPIAEEDEDNLRFAQDVTVWLGKPLQFWRNPKYVHGSAERIWDQRGAMVFPHGAPCTIHGKKEARQDYEKRHRVDWHVFGFTAEEKTRHDRFVLTERSNVLPVLIDAGLTKQDCTDRLVAAGVTPPRVYAEGYPNANCIGCVKATSPTYWNLVRRTRPRVFASRAEQSRRLGVRLVRYKGERIFLDELPANAAGRPLKTMNIECGVFCEERPFEKGTQMNKPTLEEITGGVAKVLQGMVQGLDGLVTPNVAIARAAAGAAATRFAKANLRKMIEPAIALRISTYTQTWGERDASSDTDAWDEALDNELESLFEQHDKLISSGWLGEHCTDNRAHEDDAAERIAKSFAEDAWRVLTFVPEKADVEAHYMSQSELLQSIGIDDSVITEAVGEMPVLTPQQVEEKTMATLEDTKQRLAAALRAKGEFDMSDMCNDLDDASDDDNVLANAGVERLGLLRGDVLVLRKYKSDNGVYTADGWTDFVREVEALTDSVSAITAPPTPVDQGEPEEAEEDFMAMFGGTDEPAATAPPAASPPPPAAPPAAPPPVAAGSVPPPSGPPASVPPPGAPVATEKPKRRKAGGDMPEGAIPAEALGLLKEHSGLKDEELGALVGVSRATFSNYVKGKAFLVPQPVHVDNLRRVIEDKREGLSQALDLIENA